MKVWGWEAGLRQRARYGEKVSDVSSREGEGGSGAFEGGGEIGGGGGGGNHGGAL